MANNMSGNVAIKPAINSDKPNCMPAVEANPSLQAAVIAQSPYIKVATS